MILVPNASASAGSVLRLSCESLMGFLWDCYLIICCKTFFTPIHNARNWHAIDSCVCDR